MSPLGRVRRDGATVRLSVAQGTLQAGAGAEEGTLLRKGYGNGRQNRGGSGTVAAIYLLPFQNYAGLLR